MGPAVFISNSAPVISCQLALTHSRECWRDYSPGAYLHPRLLQRKGETGPHVSPEDPQARPQGHFGFSPIQGACEEEAIDSGTAKLPSSILFYFIFFA